MTYRIVDTGDSLSFPEKHNLMTRAADDGKNIIFIGTQAGKAYHTSSAAVDAADFVAIELDTECLGVHTAESDQGPTNVLGFSRFRLGDAEPTTLIELVKKSFTDPSAVQAAKETFEAAGLVVAVCNDFPGRILNRLLRPYYNAALRRLDEGLATAKDMDTTLQLGLGYPEGPISLLERTGLHHHFRISDALFEMLGQEPYVPARRARIAWLRHNQGTTDASS